LIAREVNNNFEYDFNLAEQEKALFTELKEQMEQLNFARPKISAPAVTSNEVPLNSHKEDKIKVTEFK